MKKITKKELYKAITDYCKANGITYGTLNPSEQEKVDKAVAKLLKISYRTLNEITLR